MAELYKIVSKSTNGFYIGSADNAKKRFKRHIKDLKKNNHHCILFQECFNKNGIDDLELIILESDLTREEAFSKEDILLKRNKNNPLMFNISLGSRFGDALTRHPNRDEIVGKIKTAIHDRISELTEEEKKDIWGRCGEDNPNYRTGKFINENFCKICGVPITPGAEFCPHHVDHSGEKNNFYGKHHSKETKSIISEKNKGKQPVNCVGCNIDGVTYSSMAEASRKLGIPVPTILWRCNSKNFPNYYKL